MKTIINRFNGIFLAIWLLSSSHSVFAQIVIEASDLPSNTDTVTIYFTEGEGEIRSRFNGNIFPMHDFPFQVLENSPGGSLTFIIRSLPLPIQLGSSGHLILLEGEGFKTELFYTANGEGTLITPLQEVPALRVDFLFQFTVLDSVEEELRGYVFLTKNNTVAELIEEDDGYLIIINDWFCLFCEKEKLIKELEDLAIEPEILLSPTRVPLIKSYDESSVRNLLSAWKNGSKEDAEKIEKSLQRLTLAEKVLKRSFANAAFMSHETMLSLVELAAVILATKQVNDGLNKTLKQVQDLATKRTLIILRRIITAFFLEELLEANEQNIRTTFPPPYNNLLITALHKAIQIASDPNFLQTVTKEFLYTSVAADCDQILLKGYVSLTQRSLDNAKTRAESFELLGTVEDAKRVTEALMGYIESDASKARSHAIQYRVASRSAEYLRDITEYASLAPSPPVIQAALNGISIVLKVFSGAALTMAATETGLVLANTLVAAQDGTILAFDPDYSRSSNKTTTIKGTTLVTQGNTEKIDDFLPSRDIYYSLLQRIKENITQAKLELVDTQLDTLLDLHTDLSEAISNIRLFWSAVYIDAQSGIPAFQNAITEAENQIYSLNSKRLHLNLALTEFVFANTGSAADVSDKISNVVLSLDSTAAAIEVATSLASNIAVPPFLIVEKHDFQNDTTMQHKFQIQATIKNIGDAAAENILVELSGDSSLIVLTNSQISIGNLAAGDQYTLKWEVSQNDSSQETGVYTIDLVSSNAVTSPIIGFYSFESSNVTSVKLQDAEVSPSTIVLRQNYPNPFNPQTTIVFDLSISTNVTLEVFDVKGRKVTTLLQQQRMAAGIQKIVFDAIGLTSGLYFYRISAGKWNKTAKMVLLR